MVSLANDQLRTLSYRQRRALGRTVRQRRTLGRFGGARITAADPLVRGRASRLGSAGRAVAVVATAVAGHALVLLGFAGVHAFLPPAKAPQPSNRERVELRVVAAPKPEPDVQDPPTPGRRAPKRAPEPPPADPIDLEPAAPLPKPEPAPQRRRVVGLSFESTVTGGSGATFAIGNTLVGSTKAVAEDPTRVEKIERRSLNRAATRIPGNRLTKPRRLGAVEPIYPELLRVQGIEADVVVTITIAADGSVTTVDVIKGAAGDFDAAAVAAARQQRFEPATRNGEPVPYTLKYTYRFRLDEVRP